MDLVTERSFKLGKEIVHGQQDVFQCLPSYCSTVGLCHILKIFIAPLGNRGAAWKASNLLGFAGLKGLLR